MGRERPGEWNATSGKRSEHREDMKDSEQDSTARSRAGEVVVRERKMWFAPFFNPLGSLN